MVTSPGTQTLEEAEKVHGEIVVSRVGAIFKEASDKCRLGHDLWRTIVNARVRFSERLVLPRISDTVEHIEDLLKLCNGSEADTLVLLGFKDARSSRFRCTRNKGDSLLDVLGVGVCVRHRPLRHQLMPARFRDTESYAVHG